MWVVFEIFSHSKKKVSTFWRRNNFQLFGNDSHLSPLISMSDSPLSFLKIMIWETFDTLTWCWDKRTALSHASNRSHSHRSRFSLKQRFYCYIAEIVRYRSTYLEQITPWDNQSRSYYGFAKIVDRQMVSRWTKIICHDLHRLRQKHAIQGWITGSWIRFDLSHCLYIWRPFDFGGGWCWKFQNVVPNDISGDCRLEIIPDSANGAALPRSEARNGQRRLQI